jgi:hypothetical protein
MAASTRPAAQPALPARLPLKKRSRELDIGGDARISGGEVARGAPEGPPAVPALPAAVEVDDATAPTDRSTEQEPISNVDPSIPEPSGDTARRSRARGRQDETGDALLANLFSTRPVTKSTPITRLEPELHGTLRLISGKTGVSIQDLVNGAVRAWLRDNQRALIDHGVLEG